MHLFYDCETTGLPNWKAPSEDPSQPYICQLAAILLNDSLDEVAVLNAFIKPQGWVLNPELQQLTGITMEQLETQGIPIADALNQFFDLVSKASLVVAHNESFDARMLRIQLKRAKDEARAEAWEKRKSACTMAITTPILMLPPTPKMVAAGFTKPKSPKLEEAYRHFHDGADFEGAHNALNDVRATINVYYAAMATKTNAEANHDAAAA